MRKFVKTEKNGTLYWDKILFEPVYPILFTCKNDKNEIFVVICCQNNATGIKWLVGKTTPDNIVRMLCDEITIRELITTYSTGQFSINYDEGKYICSYDSSEWKEESTYLPKKDSYIMAEPGEFDEDIEYFTKMEKEVHYISQNEYFPIVNKKEHLENVFKMPVVEISPLRLVSNCEKNISGELIRTVQIVGELLPDTQENLFYNEFVSITRSYFTREDFESVNIDLKKETDHNLTNAA